MAHSFSSLFTHIIFSTKNREPLLSSDIRPRIFDYMGGIIRNMQGALLLINGIEDHVHILAKYPPTLALSNFIRDLKANSSAWIHETLGQNFGWQTGYAAFSVSKSITDKVRNYIANQEEHHQRVSFKDEYLDFLKRHEIPYDEHFVFEGEFVG